MCLDFRYVIPHVHLSTNRMPIWSIGPPPSDKWGPFLPGCFDILFFKKITNKVSTSINIVSLDVKKQMQPILHGYVINFIILKLKFFL